jgi:membrane protease YdiL (CAAX protease family)
MPESLTRLAGVIRLARSRWVTIPLRLVAGIATVIAASVASQAVGNTFRPGREHLESPSDLVAYFAAAALVAVAVLAAYTLFVRLTERRWPTELQPRPALCELPQGIGLGFGLSATSVAAIWIMGGYHIDGVADRSTWAVIIVRGLAIAVASSVIEELLIRGLVLRILAEVFGRWWALVVSSLLFGVLHMANPNSSVIDGLILVIEAGFLLGIAYLWTERLWLPIGLHGAWNFALAAIFGGALSGQEVSAIISAKLVGPERISGGAFGIEGSLISTVICSAAACTILLLTLRQRGFASSRQDGLALAQAEHIEEYKTPAGIVDEV